MGFERPLGGKVLEVKESSTMTEEKFLNEIERLKHNAGQLAARWMVRYDEADEVDLPRLRNEFNEFLQKREKALFSLEIPDGLDPALVAEIKQFDQNVVLSFGNTTLFQGNGGNGGGV